MKAFNVYFDQQINETTAARTFAVRSADMCALACLKAPFLCPGFDLKMTSTQDEISTLTPPFGVYRGGEEGMEGSPEMRMRCVLANGKSKLHRVNAMEKSSPDMAAGMQPSARMSNVHFKLPRHAPCAGKT